MKRLIALSVLLPLLAAFSSPAAAQRSQAELKDNLQKKLAKAWVKKVNWITDYDKALAEAKKSGKLIFAYFTRSYAY